MFDARLRPLIDPPLNTAGRWLAARGAGANAITLSGMVLAIAAAWTISEAYYLAALALVLLNRLFDGLDGAVARQRGMTDFGGYIDIVGDFVFYTAVPVGFGIAAPENLLPALVLVASFALTGTSFLAFATLAAKRGFETTAHGRKSFFYNTGLAEGTETILVFVAMCLLPQHFGTIAWFYAAVCFVTVAQRSLAAHAVFRN